MDIKELSKIKEAIARGYCTPENEAKTVDTELIEAMAIEVDKVMSKELGQVINELKSLQGKEPSDYFTDAHIDGYDHAISDAVAILSFKTNK